MRELSDGGRALSEGDRERIRLDAVKATTIPDSVAERAYRIVQSKSLTENERERLRLKYAYETPLDFDDYANASKPWVFKGLIAFNETSAWIAPPGGMKSSIMAEMAVSAALRRDWHGFKSLNEYCPAVFYFALERADLVKRRIVAQAKQFGVPDDEIEKLPIAVCSHTVDLTTTASVKDVVDAVRNFEEAECGGSVGIVIFDTFAKLIAAGGGDEDKAAWQGKVFTNLQRIKDQIGGPHVALVGHTGKDESRGARGSNAILGDADVMIQIGGDHVKTATVIKANDRAEGPVFSFTSSIYEFGKDEDGDPITVNIVSAEEVTAPAAKVREPKLTANEKTVFGILHDAGRSGLTIEDWNTAARDAGIGVKRKATLNDIHRTLKSKGLVNDYGGRWVVNHTN